MNLPAVGTMRLDRILQDAVQAHWNELMPAEDDGWVHIEYRTESDASLQYLKIWGSTTRGCWHLICEQWMTTAWSHVPGLQFFSDYYSEGLGRVLEVVTRHQSAFLPLEPCQNGMIQVSPPTKEERRTAESWIAEVLARLSASPAEQLVTAWTARQTGETAIPAQPVAAD
jgi:hypothetical protein